MRFVQVKLPAQTLSHLYCMQKSQVSGKQKKTYHQNIKSAWTCRRGKAAIKHDFACTSARAVGNACTSARAGDGVMRGGNAGGGCAGVTGTCAAVAAGGGMVAPGNGLKPFVRPLGSTPLSWACEGGPGLQGHSSGLPACFPNQPAEAQTTASLRRLEHLLKPLWRSFKNQTGLNR